MQNSQYSLYHLVGYNNISLRTIQKLVDDDGLTVYDFLLNTPKLHSIIGNRISLIKKINIAIKMIPEEQFSQPCVSHLAITGLSQHNIFLLQSLEITYSDLKDFTLADFISSTGNGRISTYQRIIEAYNELELLRTPQNKEEVNISTVDTDTLINSYIDTLKPGTFFTVNQLLEEIPKLTAGDFKVFLKKDLLRNKGLWYRKKYRDLKFYLNGNSRVKNKDVLVERIQNKTLQEIADDLNVI